MVRVALKILIYIFIVFLNDSICVFRNSCNTNYNACQFNEFIDFRL